LDLAFWAREFQAIDRRDTDANSYAHTQPEAYSHADRYTYSNPNPNADSHSIPDPDTHTRTQGNLLANSIGSAGGFTESASLSRSHPGTDCHGNADSNPHARPGSRPDTDYHLGYAATYRNTGSDCADPKVGRGIRLTARAERDLCCGGWFGERSGGEHRRGSRIVHGQRRGDLSGCAPARACSGAPSLGRALTRCSPGSRLASADVETRHPTR
ncbi:MAG: hypothetical protein OXS47_00010, partial [Chloroflexota bacterium]|nr:hypothetical protein [Chloroflexota bacterium]